LWQEREIPADSLFRNFGLVFEQNYLNIPDNRKLTTFSHDPACDRGFFSFGLPCFFGYLKTEKLIRVDQPFDERLNTHGYSNLYGGSLEKSGIEKYTILYTTRELALPLEIVYLGKYFSQSMILSTNFMFSKDEKYAFLFTANIENQKYLYTYLTHIDSGEVMKIAEGDVPVLMP
jgi:hypothetical protein